MLVQSAVCKCHPKFTPETGTSAGGEGQEYEEVEGGEGGAAMSDPTYMEVGAREGGGNTFQLLTHGDAYALQLRRNEAYNETSPFQLKGNEAYDETSPFQLKGNEAYDISI